MKSRASRKAPSVLFAILFGFTIYAGWTWLHHAHMLTERQHQAQVALRQLPRPTSYHPEPITVAGHTHGFHSAIVAAVGSLTTPAYSSLSGYWVLTYVGPNPPNLTGYVLWGVVSPSNHPIVVGHGGRWTPIRVGPNRYLYWIVRWHHQEVTALPAALARHEFQTSRVTLQLASGRKWTIVERPVKSR